MSDDIVFHINEIDLRRQAVQASTDAWVVAVGEHWIAVHELAVSVAMATLAGAA